MSQYWDIASDRHAPSPVTQVITTSARRGAEIFGTELGRALAERGWDSRTVALVPGTAPPLLDVETLGNRRLGLSTLRRLRTLTRDRLAVAHGSTTLFACAVAAKGRFVYRNIGDPAYWADSPLRRARVRWALHRARFVVALTDATAGHLTEVFGLHDGRLAVIPKGVAERRFQPADAPERRRARARLSIPPEARVGVYVGALSREKDVATAIAAVASTDIVLLVVGDGPERDALEEAAARQAPDRVRFVGALDEVEHVMAAADVAVLPSRSEGLPSTLIEAGFMGLPAVASRVGGVPEIVVDGVTGVLVPPGDPDAMAEGLIAALGASTSMGQAARARCLGRFEIEVIAGRWDELLRRIGTTA